MEVVLRWTEIRGPLQLGQGKINLLLLKVNQSEQMQEFGIVWPALQGCRTHLFRLGQTACLKVAQHEAATHIFALRTCLPSLIKSLSRAIEILSLNRRLTLPDKVRDALGLW